MHSIVALIPARSASKRIPGKNIRLLGGHPMIAYAIDTARRSEIFSDVIVSTDSEEYRELAMSRGANVPFLRPADLAGDRSPDIEWVVHALLWMREQGILTDSFAILRPTSPFRTPETIRRAWSQFTEDGGADSLRAVELCSQHPAKMWRIEGLRMKPVMVNPDPDATPWHSSQYAALPSVHVQNASLEIAWTRVPLEQGTIAGESVMPFVTEEYEGFDLNKPEDWIVAEHLVNSGLVRLPQLEKR